MARAADFDYFDTRPIALAHRGGSTYAPNVGLENSMRAFQTAVDLGYRYVETDVHATRDGILVAFHDDRLDRATDSHGEIGALPYARVREARIGGTEPVPLVAELFVRLPRTRFNLDLKSAAAVGPLWRAIEEHEAHDRVCVGSFSDVSLNRFRALSRGRVATSSGQVGAASLLVTPSRVNRWLHTPAAALQLPRTHVVRGRRVRVVSRALIDAAHRLGKHVHVWTIDDPDEMTELLDLGVDGLVTDRIDILRDVLAARGSWPQA